MGVAMAFACSCANDDLNSESIFDTSEVKRNDFDKWLKKNYTDAYNIEFNYLYNDKLSNNDYNVIPAKVSNSIAIAKLLKHVWMDAYTEVCGGEFLKNHCFRQIQLIGSGEYKGNGQMTLGTAEGGLKVLLYRINELDTANIYINHDDPYRAHNFKPLDLNYWYFHTMHHEFCHILTQTKNYSTEFQAISSAKYHASDWVNVKDIDAPKEGFVTGYASGEYNEDFAEIYATYVTNTEDAWQKILSQGVDTLRDENGNIQYQMDKNGDYVYETDEDGYYIEEEDADGFFVPETDANGEVVYLKGKNGLYYYYMYDAVAKKYAVKQMADTVGTNYRPIPMRVTQSQSLRYYGNRVYWVYGDKLYDVLASLTGDKVIAQLNSEGNPVYDKYGNMIPEYYKYPVFMLKKKVVADETGKNTLLAKLAIVRSYFKDVWGFDLDKMRDAVIRRSEEVTDNFDLSTLN